MTVVAGKTRRGPELTDIDDMRPATTVDVGAFVRSLKEEARLKESGAVEGVSTARHLAQPVEEEGVSAGGGVLQQVLKNEEEHRRQSGVPGVKKGRVTIGEALGTAPVPAPSAPAPAPALATASSPSQAPSAPASPSPASSAPASPSQAPSPAPSHKFAQGNFIRWVGKWGRRNIDKKGKEVIGAKGKVRRGVMEYRVYNAPAHRATLACNTRLWGLEDFDKNPGTAPISQGVFIVHITHREDGKVLYSIHSSGEKYDFVSKRKVIAVASNACRVYAIPSDDAKEILRTVKDYINFTGEFKVDYSGS